MSSVMAKRWFVSSTSASASASTYSEGSISLKKLIQPFVMKCHPDTARQQGLPESARKTNLEAIKNLNSYVDGVRELISSSSNNNRSNRKYPFPNEGHTVEIEFVMSMDRTAAETTTTTSKKLNSKNNQFVVSTSRRKLEFLVPSMDMSPAEVGKYATRQFLRLLRISDLPTPASLSLYDNIDVDNDADDSGNDNRVGNNESVDPLSSKAARRRPVSAWEASRERFWRRHHKMFDHKKLQATYKEALHDAEVHLRTRGWIRDNPKLRHQLLANVLSRVRFVESITPLERLVAYRRLLRFLDEHFDELRLEDSGRYWEEQTKLVLGESRPYNTSPSALRKLRKKQTKRLRSNNNNQHQQFFETGYSFAIHHDDTVTVTVPIDFDNHELLQELLRNMEDFLQTKGTGLEGDFYSAMYGQDNSVF